MLTETNLVYATSASSWSAINIPEERLLLRTPAVPVELQKRRIATHEQAEPPFVAHMIGQANIRKGAAGRQIVIHGRLVSRRASCVTGPPGIHRVGTQLRRPAPPFAYDRVAAGNETPTMRSNTAPVASAWISLSTTSMAQSRRVQLRGL